MRKLLLFITVLFSFSCFSQTLDPTFNGNGIVTTQISSNPPGDYATDAALQSDGKIIILSTNKVLRLNTDNSIDTSFNGCGFVILNSQIETVAIQSDGKIIVAGTNIVYRMNTDGSLDSSFGTEGKVAIQINNFNMTIKSIALRSDSNFFLAGYVSNGMNTDYAIASLNTDGSFDTFFDTDGKVTLDLFNYNDFVNDMVIQNDGKIIITGKAYYSDQSGSTPYKFTTARFNTDGSLDLSFGLNGIVITNFGLSSSSAFAIDIQSDGAILILGIYSTSKIVLARYTPNGDLDTTFNTTGKLITNNSSIQSNYNYSKPHLKCLSNGKILISATGNGNVFNLLQINNNGSFDANFGVNGISTYSINTNNNSAFLLTKPNNEIVTGGTSINASIPRIEKIEFSNNGDFLSENFYNIVLSVDSILDMIEQSTGKIIVFGGTSIYSKTKLVRYNVDGSIDTTFGSNGILAPDNPSSILVKQFDDKFLIINVNTGQSILRYTADGVLDSTFGVNGVVDFSQDSPLIVSFINNIAVSQNGKLNVAFDFSTDGSQCGPTHFGVLRLNSDGTVDTSFGVNGYSQIPFDCYATQEAEFSQVIYEDTDGKLILSGAVEPFSNTMGQVATARFNPDGTIDTTFGTNGKTVIQIGNFNIGTAIVKTLNNKYLINSRNSTGTPSFTSLLQLNYNGTVDTTFGNNGILSDQVHYFDVICQPDGKILYGGTTNGQFAVYRSFPDGSVDNSFGTNGKYVIPIYYYSSINKLLYLQNGSVLAAGNSINGTNQVFALARYTFNDLATESYAINSFKLYPNPASNKFTIDFGNDWKTSNYQVKIINLLGQVVYTSIEKNAITTIPVSWSGKGMFLVNILDEQNNLIKTDKLIIK